MRKIPPDELITYSVNLLSRIAKANKAAEWDASKQPARKQPKLYTDREWNILGLRVIEYHPLKAKPEGWSVLWHKWNRGITLNYSRPLRTSHIGFLKRETETSIDLVRVQINDPLTFWQRRLPHGFSLTIAKLYGKWTITRSPEPFMEAMIKNAPLLSKQDWDDLGKPEGIIEK